nr:unnamed protein product [Callosobruchus analis]
MSLYTGRQSFFDTRTGLAEKIVLDLTDYYLNQGRTIVTDNYYTSPSLARNLLAKETHLLGTLRKNRRGLPPEVIKAKLKKREITAILEYDTDKEDVDLSDQMASYFSPIRKKHR